MADEKKSDSEFIEGLGSVGLNIDGLTDEEKANLNNDGHTNDFGEEVSGIEEENVVVDKDDPEPAKTPSEEEKKAEAEKALQERLAAEKIQSEKEWQDKLDAIEKRRLDTEKAFQKEHKEKLDLRKKLDKRKLESSLKKKKVSKPEDDPEDLLFGDEPEDDENADLENADGHDEIDDDGDSEIRSELEEVKRKQEELEKKQKEDQIKAEEKRNLDLWNSEAEKVKVEKPDFDEVVYGTFHSAFNASPAVKAKFEEKGSTPAAAYEIGLELKAYEDALEGKKKVEINTETAKEKDAKKIDGIDPTTALGGNSSGVAKPNSGVNNVVSNVDAALNFD